MRTATGFNERAAQAGTARFAARLAAALESEKANARPKRRARMEAGAAALRRRAARINRELGEPPVGPSTN